MKNYLVEECFVLTPRDVGRRNDRVRKIGGNALERRADISYWFDNMDEPTRLFVCIAGHKPQSFAWEEVEITFGDTAYFYCACGYRAAKLYLPPNESEFKCRKCHGLRYEITTINRASASGRALYRLNRMIKLANSREKINVFYNGDFTKGFKRFLTLSERAGFGGNDEAEDLITFVKSQSF